MNIWNPFANGSVKPSLFNEITNAAKPYMTRQHVGHFREELRTILESAHKESSHLEKMAEDQRRVELQECEEEAVRLAHALRDLNNIAGEVPEIKAAVASVEHLLDKYNALGISA